MLVWASIHCHARCHSASTIKLEMTAARNLIEPLAAPLAVSQNGVAWVAVPNWGDFDWLRHGFSTRAGGVSRVYLPKSADENTPGELNLGFTSHDIEENVRENRSRLIEAVSGSRDTPLATVRQIHSSRSIVVNAGNAGIASELVPQADGIMTNHSGLMLGIQTADCIPVLVADPVQRAVAAFHAGWRGTVERIVELGIRRMREEFGSDPANLVAAIGPGIGACCYTVGDEVLARFDAGFSYSRELFSEGSDGADAANGAVRSALRLDLIEANHRQLLAAGLDAGSIAVVGGCTACQPGRFYSHRASGGHAGRMMAVIGIR
jgi:YfiH family protein